MSKRKTKKDREAEKTARQKLLKLDSQVELMKGASSSGRAEYEMLAGMISDREKEMDSLNKSLKHKKSE